MKALMKMDKQIARWILAWIEKNIEGTTNPRLKGKGLVGDKSGVWRYRVGNYRILAHIDDHELLVLLVDFGHRKDIYN
jgi:mRNA interferase RelE/StbE